MFSLCGVLCHVLSSELCDVFSLCGVLCYVLSSALCDVFCYVVRCVV